MCKHGDPLENIITWSVQSVYTLISKTRQTKYNMVAAVGIEKQPAVMYTDNFSRHFAFCCRFRTPTFVIDFDFVQVTSYTQKHTHTGSRWHNLRRWGAC